MLDLTTVNVPSMRNCVSSIRSFGPDDGDEQQITFHRPLTLILGQNGCGKTTIIECLRYAITGHMPSGKHDAFVYDTKVNKSSEVRAQVKLKLINAKDEEVRISRSMQVTAQKTKTKFQTLDSLLSITDASGRQTDISSRCIDLDLAIHEHLGVSKAILNSVIFCHQDDSNWPLDEGKKVKDRFDEIFDAEKYSACFEKLKKIRKEYLVDIKLLEQKVSHLSEKKEDLDKKKLELVNTETKISDFEIQIVNLKGQLKPIAEKLQTIEKVEKELVRFESTKEKIKARLENCIDQQRELKKHIQKLFTGPKQRLMENIANYDSEVSQKQSDLTYKEECLQDLKYKMKQSRKELENVQSKLDQYTLLEKQNEERIKERNQKIKDVAASAEVVVAAYFESNEAAAKGMKSLNQKLQEKSRDLEELKNEADVEEKRLQRLVDDCIDALARHRQKIVTKDGEIQQCRKEISRLEKEICDANESKLKLESLERRLKSIEAEYEDTVKELDPEKCQHELNEDEKLLDQLDNKSETLNDKIAKLQKQSTKLAEKDVLEENLKSKEKAFNVLKNKHRPAILELLNKMPDTGFAVALKQFECKTKDEVDSMKRQINEKSLKVSSWEAERKHVRETLNERRAELTGAEDVMYRACGTQSYEATLARVTAQVEKLQEEQHTLQSSKVVIDKYKKQLAEHSSCPLCNRGFDSENEVQELISDLGTQVMNVPAKLEKVSEEFSRASEKKDDLLALKSLNEKIHSLKEDIIPKLEKRIADLDKDLNEASECIEELSMSAIEPEQRLQTAKRLLGEMPLLDRYALEIQQATKDLEAIKSQCVGVEGDMSLDEAMSAQSELRQKISTLRARVKANQAALNNHQKKLQRIMQKKNETREELLNIQKKVQEVVTIQENLKQLESNREKFILELKALRDSTSLLENELRDKEKKKQIAVEEKRKAIDQKRSNLNSFTSSIDKIKEIDRAIKLHEDTYSKAELTRLNNEKNRLTEKIELNNTLESDFLIEMDEIKKELAQQEIFKRDLEDNLKLLEAQETAARCQRELADAEAAMSGVNVGMLADKEALITKQTRVFREKAIIDGKISEAKVRLDAIKHEMKDPRNVNLEKSYKESFCELRVMKLMEKDIKDYGNVMEQCVLRYHKDKMANINLIIKQMWRKIYRGNDIDYIEIKTEGGAVSDTSDRRRYDYRVVQCKNGVEIDMRGRCSAGQKVLACLIIRLALAETFSTRFGMLALDEPTTNLDEENVRSLCSALAEIVQERMSEKNFMFVIITHDKEFIDTLGAIDRVSHYYEVSRNDEGKSRIRKNRFT